MPSKLSDYTPEELQALGMGQDTIDLIHPVATPQAPMDFSGAATGPGLTVGGPGPQFSPGFAGQRKQSQFEAKKAEKALQDAQEVRERARAQQLEAIQYSRDLGEQRAAEMGAFQDRHRREVQKIEAENLSSMNEQRDAMRAQREKIQKYTQLANEGKIDTDRFMSAGANRWIAAIAVAMGEMGRALSGGGPNAALGIINAQIDRDIAEQEAALNVARGKAEAESSVYQMMRQEFGDDRSARLAYKNAVLERQKQRINELVGEYAEPAAEEKRMALVAAIGQQQAQNEEEVAQRGLERAQKDIAFRERSLATQEQLAQSRERLGLERAETVAKLTAPAQGGAKALPATTLQKLGGLKTAERMLDDLDKDWGKKTGFFSGLAQFFPGTDASKYNDRRKVAAQVIGSILEGGKLTESDFDRYVDMLPTPGDAAERKDNKIKAIKRLLAMQREGEAEALTGGGFAVGDVGNVPPDAEELERLGMLEGGIIEAN